MALKFAKKALAKLGGLYADGDAWCYRKPGIRGDLLIVATLETEFDKLQQAPVAEEEEEPPVAVDEEPELVAVVGEVVAGTKADEHVVTVETQPQPQAQAQAQPQAQPQSAAAAEAAIVVDHHQQPATSAAIDAMYRHFLSERETFTGVVNGKAIEILEKEASARATLVRAAVDGWARDCRARFASLLGAVESLGLDALSEVFRRSAASMAPRQALNAAAAAVPAFTPYADALSREGEGAWGM